MYFEAVQQVAKSLSNVEGWFDKAAKSAAARGIEPGVFLTAQLAADQYNLTRQVQAACDAAKFLAARVSGKTPPAHPDTETSEAELRARLGTVVSYLRTFKPEDFAGVEARAVPLSWMPGKGMRAPAYFWELALPNFYFHVSMIYAILRNNGVDLGKADYVGALSIIDV